MEYGLNHITTLVEQKKAKLVVIAHDVDPIELVIWLPQLCRKMDVPFCFVKGKARLGKLVHKKNATAVALVEVRSEDKPGLSTFASSFKAAYNDNESLKRTWGGGIMGIKSQHREEAKQKAKDQEALRKANM